MSEENVELIRRLYSSWGSRDWAAVFEFVDSDAVLDFSRNIFNPGVVRGHEAIRERMEQANETWENFDMRPEEYIDCGDAVVTSVRLSGQGPSSGVPVDMTLFQVLVIRDGKVTRMAGGYQNRTEALAAAQPTIAEG